MKTITFFTLTQFRQHTGININFLHYQGLIAALKLLASKNQIRVLKRLEQPIITSNVKNNLKNKTRLNK